MLILLFFAGITVLYHLIGGPNKCLSLLWILGMLAALAFLNLRTTSPSHSNKNDRMILPAYFSVLFFAICLYGYTFANLQGVPGARSEDFQFGIFLAGLTFSGLFIAGNFSNINNQVMSVFSFAGAYSYSLYLTHFSLIVFILSINQKASRSGLNITMTFLVCHIVAVIFYLLFDKHYRILAYKLKSMKI